VVATRGTVAQEVSITGNVKPVENVNLAFEKSDTQEKASVHPKA